MVPLLKETNFALVENLGRPRTALFVGFGVAESAAALRTRGAKVVALEGSDELLDRAKDLVPEVHAVDLAKPDLFRPAEGSTFDLVAMEGACERVSSLPKLFEGARAHLVDGGHLVVSFEASGPHTREAVHAALESAGFEVMRYDMNPRFFRSELERTAKTVDDLRIAYTTSFRYTRHAVRPAEKLVAMRDPDRFAADHVWVARVPPKRGPLSLTVGMLTLNEIESVERMIDDIRAVAPDAKILLIDSSSDKTPELAKAKGARVVRQLPPQGHGPAMERLMYEAAKDTEALIYLDCDFTYPTEKIPAIRKLLEDGADVVNASRTATFQKAMPLPNFLANRVMAGSAQLAHGLPTTDVHSGMRGYRCSVVRGFSFDGSGDAIPLDTLILPAKSGYKVVEFPIEYKERVGASKLAKLRGVLWTYIRIAGAFGHGERVGGPHSHYDRRRQG
jgi:protein-L-isoaspartate O-methyltransferase